MKVDDCFKSFDFEAYLRGFLGSVVRFGAAAIHGQSSNNRKYAGWGVNHIGQRDGQKNRSL